MNRYIPKITQLFLLLAAVYSFTSCTGTRKAVREPIKEQGAEYLVQKLQEHQFVFHQFSAKFNASYQVDQKTTNVSGTIRISRDSIIWISISPALGIEAVRFMLTPDSIKYMNRLNNTYLSKSFSYINELMNRTLDYDMAQSFLLGNDFSLYESNTFKALIELQQYKLTTTDRQKLRRNVRRSDSIISIPLQSIWLDPESFKIQKVLLKEAERDSRKFVATYDKFESIESKLIPTNLAFVVETNEKKIRIEINYSKIQIDQEQTYSFRIPDSYTEIQSIQPDKK